MGNIQQNQSQWHIVNYFDICFVSKCRHISNSRYRGLSAYATFGTWKKFALAKNRISKIFYFMYAVTK